MGASAYNRGSALISRQISEEARPVEFEIMDRLNSIPKAKDAGTPFTDVRLSASHGGWWILCPKTGFGYWYSSLHQLMHHWRIVVVGYENGDWLATKPLEDDS